MNTKINEQIQAITAGPKGVSEGELSDLLTAIQLIQAGKGHGTIFLRISDGGILDIDTHVMNEPPKRTGPNTTAVSWRKASGAVLGDPAAP
jgi:hypothetical protein